MKALKSDEDAGYINNIAILFSFFYRVYVTIYDTIQFNLYDTKKDITYKICVTIYDTI